MRRRSRREQFLDERCGDICDQVHGCSACYAEAKLHWRYEIATWADAMEEFWDALTRALGIDRLVAWLAGRLAR